MAYIIADRVKETSISIGTGTIALGGASTGYRRFADVMTVGDTCPYVIALNTEWEVGIATYSAANTLTRTTIHSSSNAGSAVNFSAGTKDVFLGPTAETVPEFNPITNTITSGVWGGSTIPVLKGGTGVTTSTGTGSVVLSNTPTLVTPQTNGINAVPVVSGAGNSLTLTAGSGVGTGAGGSLILQAGLRATSGGDGKVVVKQVSGQTSNLLEWQDSGGTITNKITRYGGLTFTFYSDTTPSGSGEVGLYNGNGQLIVCAGTSRVAAFGAYGSTFGAVLSPTAVFGWSGGANLSGGNFSTDCSLYRDASDTLAQRRSTNAQTFRLYNTYTDASNYERLVMDWSTTANVGYIGFQRAGTGVARNVIVDLGANPTAGANRIQTIGTNNVAMYSGNVNHIQFINGTITFLGENAYGAGTTRTLGLGIAAGGNANRNADKYVFRAIGFGTGNTTPTYVGFGAAYVPAGITSTQSHTQEDCFLVRLLASATPIVAFGDSFASTVPAIKRVGTQLRVRLADDSADASFSAQYIQTPALTVATLPSASTAGMGSRAFVSDANATTFASVVAGGGSNKVPVYSDGTNWLIG